MNIKEVDYWICDSRAQTSIGDSCVYEVCDSLEEAKRNRKDYEDGNCPIWEVRSEDFTVTKEERVE